MTDPIKRQPITSSVVAHLEAIWEADGTGSAPTREVAERLCVSPTLVTNRQETPPFASGKFAERVAEFLGNPEGDPHGRTIPKAAGTLPPGN